MFRQRARSTPETMDSARANSPESMIKPDAAAFSSSCAGRLAPTMAEATLGSRSTQARENCDRVQPASAASGLSFWTAARISGVSQVCIIWPIDWLVARESEGGGAPGAYLPDSTPWASGDQTICETPVAAH